MLPPYATLNLHCTSEQLIPPQLRPVGMPMLTKPNPSLCLFCEYAAWLKPQRFTPVVRRARRSTLIRRTPSRSSFPRRYPSNSPDFNVELRGRVSCSQSRVKIFSITARIRSIHSSQAAFLHRKNPPSKMQSRSAYRTSVEKLRSPSSLKAFLSQRTRLTPNGRLLKGTSECGLRRLLRRSNL